MTNNNQNLPWVATLLIALAFHHSTQEAAADALDEWTARQQSTNGFQLSQVVYGKGIYVAAGGAGDGGTILTSSNGLSWTVRADGRQAGHSPSLIWSLAYINGGFVGVGHFGGTAVSTDGIVWSYGYADSTGLTGVSYGAGKYVAAGSAQGTFMGAGLFTSANGLAWSRATINPPEIRDFYDVAYGASRFIAISYGGFIYTSTDGSAWTRGTNVVNGKTVTYCNNRFIIPAVPGTNLVSITGLSWKAEPTGLTNLLGKPIYIHGLYVARTRTGLGVSRDGTNWTLRAIATQPGGLGVNDAATISSDGRYLVTVGSTNSGIFSNHAFTYRSAPVVDIAVTTGPSLLISGVTGSNYRIEWTNSFSSGAAGWQALTNLTLTSSPQLVTDVDPASQRYYRAVLLP